MNCTIDYRSTGMNHTGVKYSAPVTSRTTASTTHQTGGELNKGEYNLWSDNSSFGMYLVYTVVCSIKVKVCMHLDLIELNQREPRIKTVTCLIIAQV